MCLKHLCIMVVFMLMSLTAHATSGFWGNASGLPITPYGNKSAVSCHNCYVTASTYQASLTQTLQRIHVAQNSRADLIELDLRYINGQVYVIHDAPKANQAAVLLDDVLADDQLRLGDQILFIEIKDDAGDSAFVDQLFSIIDSQVFIKATRPLVIRSFNLNHLERVRAKLNSTYQHLASNVRLSKLFGSKPTIGVINTVANPYGLYQVDMVEFPKSTPNLPMFIDYAKNQKSLGVNLYTFRGWAEEVVVAALRDEVDAFTIDYFGRSGSESHNTAMARSLILANAVITDNNGLVKFDANELPCYSNQFIYKKHNTQQHFATTQSPPLLDCSSEFAKTSAGFTASNQHYLRLYDGDNHPSDGFMVSAAVAFSNDSLNLPNNTTSAIVNKSDGAGFALELYKGSGNQTLRFGVYVNGTYVYANYPAQNLVAGQTYYISGAYDGNGGVWMFVDNHHGSVTNGAASGGVKLNNSPITIGADPQGWGQPRFFFDGNIQKVIVQNWGEAH